MAVRLDFSEPYEDEDGVLTIRVTGARQHRFGNLIQREGRWTFSPSLRLSLRSRYNINIDEIEAHDRGVVSFATTKEAEKVLIALLKNEISGRSSATRRRNKRSGHPPIVTMPRYMPR